jgi:hypothetical protein
MTAPHLVVAASWPALWRNGLIAVHPPATLEPREKLREARRNLGLCLDCGKPAKVGRIYCVHHARENNERVKRCKGVK